MRGAPRITAANRKWWILATMTGSLSMVLIDETVVGVALPTIQRELDMSQTELQWAVNAYLLRSRRSSPWAASPGVPATPRAHPALRVAVEDAEP